MTFAPVGGMNQDDSIVTPTRDYAGKNAFEVGDYKYAANLRIGSSRKDNLGDAETIKDTLGKSTYFDRAVVNTNPEFTGGALTGWSQIAVSGGTAWTTVGADALCLAGAGGQLSSILYQPITPTGKRMGFWVKMRVSYLNQSSYCRLVFLNGTTIISSQDVFSAGANLTVNDFIFEKYINAEIPLGCTHVGVQVYFTSLTANYAIIQGFKFFDWDAGSRPSGTERTIGKLWDKENNLLYYCVYNASGNHSIRFYNPDTGGIYNLLVWSGLNFGSTYFESMALIDNYLGITDGITVNHNAPRLIDVWSISDLFLILGSSNFREYHISFHKWAPIQPPIVKAYWDTVTNNIEKFYNKAFQFAYRYVYAGNLKSRYSPVSACANKTKGSSLSVSDEITAIELEIPGFSLDTPGAITAYNYFNNNDVKFYSVVEKIEIVFRDNERDPWKILKVHDVMADDNTSFMYDGKSNSTPIAESEFTQLFDVVPFKAGTIEAIDNRFVFGNTLEEKDIAPPVQVTEVVVNSWVQPDATLYWNRASVDPADNATFFAGCSAGDANELGLRNAVSRLTFKGRGIYKLGIQWIAENGWRSAVYTNASWIYEIPAEQGSVDNIYSLSFKFPSTFRPPVWAVAYQIVRTNCINIDYFMFGPCNEIRALIDDNSGFTDQLQSPLDLRDRQRQHFEDARAIAGNNFKTYLKVLKNKNIFKSLGADIRKTALAANIPESSRLYINIANWYASSDKSGGTDDNPLNNLYYNYREGLEAKLGDRVRFIGSTNATPADADKVIYDYPIIEFTGRGIIVEKPPGLAWLPGNSAQADAKDMMIEVYTPYQAGTENYLYHEVGEWYPVLYPGTEQRDMAKRDWTYTNNAAITCTTYGDFKVFNNAPFDYGDCHAVYKDYYFDYKALLGNVYSINTCSMVPDPNRTFDFWEYAIGRTYPAYDDLPTVRYVPTKVRFGGQIVEESLVNNLNRFREEDNKIFPTEYGRIRALVNTANAQVESVGAILLAIGERETFSIYVNRTTLEDLSGRSQVALSDRVLGSYNTLLGSQGTLNPESICVERGRVYFWDATDGAWIQYGRDGLTAISFYKMRNWFRELGALLSSKYSTSTPPWVVSEYNPYTEELTTLINHADLPSTFRDYTIYKGAVFNDDDNRWKYCHSYEPEMFARLDTQLISFVAGTLYLHEQGSGYSTFYNSKNDVYLEPVATGKNMVNWQTIAVTATDKWSVERFLSEYRGLRSKQLSSLTLAQMEYKEDKYTAAIKQDVNTVNATNAIITGDNMRSRALRALLKLDPAVVTESLLFYVDIAPIDSPRNP
jgi:hypothetical protein